jgi:hypothetical protein
MIDKIIAPLSVDLTAQSSFVDFSLIQCMSAFIRSYSLDAGLLAAVYVEHQAENNCTLHHEHD